MIIMGVDFGDARTGLAICDKGEMLASPVCVVSEKDFTQCQEKVAALAKEHRAELLVVGYPKNMNGTVGERAELCQKFGDGLKEMTGIPVVMWDERCTTVSAHSYLNVTNTRGKKRKAVVDAVAATIILESYLAYRKNQAIQCRLHGAVLLSVKLLFYLFSVQSLRCMGIFSAPSFSRFS